MLSCLYEINAWATEFPVWLSNREGYARGYREGLFLAHETICGIIEKYRDMFEAADVKFNTLRAKDE